MNDKLQVALTRDGHVAWLRYGLFTPEAKEEILNAYHEIQTLQLDNKGQGLYMTVSPLRVRFNFPTPVNNPEYFISAHINQHEADENITKLVDILYKQAKEKWEQYYYMKKFKELAEKTGAYVPF
ncbi:hypothetical protein EJ419_06260 [Alloscardovia theropitheci]|uniref:Uncharacterized protein n=1 Tax=Alloscardovia theropitheci TaxID=2496842 RepID=A0A4R0QNS1_9BIFI|nr:hypothetical protein [Alloscardovia theropitheci]TCD53852.1 hypothetical protein EJ419_06260 [Alloscardovia theropitheci]